MKVLPFFMVAAALLYVSPQPAMATDPKAGEAFLQGSWGAVRAKDDRILFETSSRCGSSRGTWQSVPEEDRNSIAGIPFTGKQLDGKTIRGNLAFGMRGGKLVVVSRFKEDNMDDMFNDQIKPKIADITLVEKPEDGVFFIGKIPGLFSERTIRIVGRDKFVLLAGPKDKGGFGGGVPDITFYRCTGEQRSLKPGE